MLKPHSLRAHLTEATPELRREPDKLSIYVTDGKIIAAGTGSLSFVYRYTLKVVVLDYSSHADAIFVPLLDYLQTEQVEIFENPDLRERSIRFEAEYLNKVAIDLSIEVDLTERVVVVPGPDPTAPDTTQRFDVKHVSEPAHVGRPQRADHAAVYAQGKALAAWSRKASTI